MEKGPLTLAHNHGKAASLETQKGNISTASSEHNLAAAEFSNALKGTGDFEAIRVLRLLELEHIRLAEHIKATSQPVAHVLSTTEEQEEEGDDPTTTDTPASAPRRTDNAPRRRSPPHATPGSTSPVSSRRPPRDLSSSIASNLATARGRPTPQSRRGLPASPEVSAHNAGGRMVGLPDRRVNTQTTDSRRQPGIPAPVLGPTRTDKLQQTSNASNPADDNFNRFFSTFEGLFSKISAPLAFAGLPLYPDNSTQPEPPTKAKEPPSRGSARARSRAPDDPDLNFLYSPAALRAIKDDVGAFPANSESFYVVPPSGGTISYAHMAAGRNQGPTSVGDDGPARSLEDDEFVDARETFDPDSPRASRHSRDGSMNMKASALITNRRLPSGRQAPRGTVSQPRHSPNRKTNEELELENEQMKKLLDMQSKRLAMWEASSQSQSMALAQSIRAANSAAGGSSAGTVTGRPPRLEREGSSGVGAGRVIQDPLATTVSVSDAAAAAAGKLKRDRERRAIQAGAEAADLDFPVAAFEDAEPADGDGRKELERQIRELRDEREKLELVSQKQKRTIERYREQWEVLKKSARGKMEERKAGAAAGGGGGGNGGPGASVSEGNGSGNSAETSSTSSAMTGRSDQTVTPGPSSGERRASTKSVSEEGKKVT
ncbi:hypothetical protein K402DRAFT_444003 [Aulographum hederae CBS 113979]|uniref:Uncharacterized protein n=1 Tax=Aulographum hederae CBS 113979 TaxID=1176131 RepID=A0A6G1HE13_9PEZI|nr:hypothetical protein K402DRAFT_444003 [Aulographum hederae CBS 113979]